MSLVERLFPASELAALKHAVLAADDQPSAKRRKIERHNSVRSRRSTDSGYNSDESTHACKPTLSTLTTQKSTSVRPQQPASPAASQSDEEDFCEKIAQARARLYSNASLSIPSPPASLQEADSPKATEEYHSPVSVEPLANKPTTSTSGCNLGTFISLGLAVTSYERNLLTSLTPEPEAIASYNAELRARKLQWLQRRRAALMQEQLSQRRRSSYQGFAISTHDEDDAEEDVQVEAPAVELDGQSDGARQSESPVEELSCVSVEQIDDFFNIEAASEEEASPSDSKSES